MTKMKSDNLKCLLQNKTVFSTAFFMFSVLIILLTFFHVLA